MSIENSIVVVAIVIEAAIAVVIKKQCYKVGGGCPTGEIFDSHEWNFCD